MFESRSQLKDKLTALEADHAELENDLTAAKAELETVQAELAELREAKAEFESTITAIKTERDEAIAKADEFEAELEAEKAKTTPEAISALVTAQLATAGHPVIDLSKPDGDGKTAAQTYRELQSTDPHAAAEYWDANRDKIINS